MNEMLLPAILVAIISTLSNWWVSHLLTRSWLYPLWTGFLVGLAMGEPLIGMQAGAYINLAYLGWVTVGGTMPGNLSVAGVFGTAITILSGADPSLAVGFAVPLSLFGILTFQATMSLNTIWVHRAEMYLDRGNITMMRVMNYVPSGILNFLLTGIPAFLLVYLGGDFMQNFFEAIPQNIVGALEVVGAMMPALGIALLLNVMANKKIIPFYFLGFLLAVYFGLDIMGIALVAGVLGLIFYRTNFLNLEGKEV